MPSFELQDDFNAIRWLTCLNGAGEEIPPFSAVRVSSADTNGIITVAKPNADHQYVYITGPTPIPTSSYGICTRDTPIFAYYNTGNTPAEGETWGATSGSFRLTKNYEGFYIHGGHGNERVYVRRAATQELTFINESGIAAAILTDNARMCIQTRTSAVSVAATGFGPDRWYIETENNGVDYAAQTDPFTGSCCSARFTKTTSTGKFLVAQWLKACPFAFYNSRAVHVQMAVKASGALTLNMGFFLWTGTDDAITSPSVSVWNASTVTPTWAAGLTSSTLAASITTSYANWTAYTSGLTFDNLGLLVWTDSQVTAGTWIEFTDAFLASGTEYLTPYPVAPKIDIDACAYHGTLGGVFN